MFKFESESGSKNISFVMTSFLECTEIMKLREVGKSTYSIVMKKMEIAPPLCTHKMMEYWKESSIDLDLLKKITKVMTIVFNCGLNLTIALIK